MKYLEKQLVVRNGFLTIAGQTAPGGGITLRNHPLIIAADQVVVRFIRSRPGDGAGDTSDAIWVREGKDIIIDHCSASWASDETLSVSPDDISALRPIDRAMELMGGISRSQIGKPYLKQYMR